MKNEVAKREAAWPELIESKLPDVMAALPQGTVEAAQLKVAFLSAFNAKPKLRECSKMSVFAALINCASLGLIPETPEQHAYLIPRWNRETEQVECNLQIGYRGFVHMILRGGEVSHIDGDIVHKGDAYEFQKGEPVVCKFSPDLSNPNRRDEPVIAAYCLIVFRNGERKLEIMDAGDLKKIEAAMMSQNSNKMSPAWKAWKTEMLRKAPIKRAAKTSNLGILIAKAAELDNGQFLQSLPADRKPLLMPSGGVYTPDEPKGPQEALEDRTEPSGDEERDPKTGDFVF